MARALVAFADGFEDVEGITVVDVLRRGGVETVTASVSDSRDVETSHGIPVRADALFRDVCEETFDAIVLPGGIPGTDNLRACRPLVDKVRVQYQKGGLVCAICAAPTILCTEGIVRPETHITCHPGCVARLERPVVDAPVVEDGNLVTAQAAGSALLFALVILARLAGPDKARAVARGMATDVFE